MAASNEWKHIPSRARHPPRSLDCASENDELHAIDDGRTACTAYERLDEGLQCIHRLEWVTVGECGIMVVIEKRVRSKAV